MLRFVHVTNLVRRLRKLVVAIKKLSLRSLPNPSKFTNDSQTLFPGCPISFSYILKICTNLFSSGICKSYLSFGQYNSKQSKRSIMDVHNSSCRNVQLADAISAFRPDKYLTLDQFTKFSCRVCLV